MDRSVTDLYRSHASFVERVLRRSGVAARDLSDATQDVFVVAHRRLGDFEGRSSPRTWLYRIAWNVASEYRRRPFRRRELLDDSIDPGGEVPSVHEDLETQRSLDALLCAIDRLEADKREALICHELEEQPMQAVAKRLGIPLKTAFSRLYAARRALKQELERQGWACAPMFAWPFKRVTAPLRWSVLVGRAVAAMAFVGMVPAEPALVHEPSEEVEAAPQLARAAAEHRVRVQPEQEVVPVVARRGVVKPRVRALAAPAPRPIAAENEGADAVASTDAIEPMDLRVVHAGQFDLGSGPFGESPLADPPVVEPSRHPRARLAKR